jgi:hypothetical protein
VPYVADAIVTGNQQGKNPRINLVSIAIGNGVGGDADDDEQTRRSSDFWYGHGSVSYQGQQSIVAACGVNGSITPECNKAIDKAQENIGGPFYVSGPSTTPSPSSTPFTHSSRCWPSCSRTVPCPVV